MRKKVSRFQSKYNYNKETLNFPSSIDYTVSLDGSILAAINETNNFSLYFIEDIGMGHIRCFYKNTDKNVSALAFANLSNLSLFKDCLKKKARLGSNFQNSTSQFLNCNNHLVIANFDKPTLQIFDLTNYSFSDEIKIANPIISMKIDKFNPSHIFYIEKGTRNLIKYNLSTAQTESITSNVLFFEELSDGSLLISSETGLKYFDKQFNLTCVQLPYIKPLAFFSLAYQKVLMIGTTGCLYPSFTVFNPLSQKKMPSYKLPYFKIDNKENLLQERCTFSCCGSSNNSFYIGSSSSDFVVHCISEGDFYSIEKVENVHFPVLSMQYIQINYGILAIIGNSKLSLFKFNNDNRNINIYDLPIINKEITQSETCLEQPKNEELKETFRLINELPKPSNPLHAVNFLKSEADPVLKSSDSLNTNIQSVFKEQALAINLSSQLKNKPEWQPSDSRYFSEKIKREKAILQRLLKKSSAIQPNNQLPSFNHIFAYHVDNTNPADFQDSEIKKEKKEKGKKRHDTL